MVSFNRQKDLAQGEGMKHLQSLPLTREIGSVPPRRWVVLYEEHQPSDINDIYILIKCSSGYQEHSLLDISS